MEDVWKALWPSSTVLGDYIFTNRTIFKDKTILELGAGSTAVPSIVSIKCGARKVIVTDKISSDTPKIQRLQRKNLSQNLTKVERKKFLIAALDWKEAWLTKDFIERLDTLDFILGSDIFYDPSVFEPIIETVALLLKKFPECQFIYAYQIRDCRWSILPQLYKFGLKGTLLQRTFEGEHEILIGKITSKASKQNVMASGDHKKVYAGVEGGATNFNFIIIDSDAQKLGEGSGLGLNLLLEGIEATADKIAKAICECAKTNNIRLPLDALGLGLSGAEDDEVNASFIDYFISKHSDVCSTIHLTTDAVISIAATFKRGGVVIIAGTGSSCRLLKEDGDVYGCGGWGHLISDVGSGFWISQNAVRLLFDVEDNLVKVDESIDNLKTIILNHFQISNKSSILNFFYGSNFNKARIASLCQALAAGAENDPLISKLFYDAGNIIGKMLVAVSKNFDQEMYNTTPLLAIGSVWKSWNLLRQGFIDALKSETLIHRVAIYQLKESPRIGAAVLAARIKLGDNFDHVDTRGDVTLVDEIVNV